MYLLSIYRCPHTWLLSLQPILQKNLQLQPKKHNRSIAQQTIRFAAKTNVPSQSRPQNCHQHGPNDAEDIRQRLLQKPSTRQRALHVRSGAVYGQQVEGNGQRVRIELGGFQQGFRRSHEKSWKGWSSHRNERRNPHRLHSSQLKL